MKLLFWIVIALAGLALAFFAASNRGPVAIGFWPLSFALELPLYLALLLTFLAGVICGALATWVSGRHWRREARRRRRGMAALEHELEATQAQMPGAEAAAPHTPPARPETPSPPRREGTAIAAPEERGRAVTRPTSVTPRG